MSLGAEYAFYWNLPESIDKLKQVGIEAIVTQFPSNDNPKTIEEFIKFQKDEVRVTAQALGGEALEKEKLWNEYFDSKVDMILSRTKNLKPEEIPNVYYACSDEGLVCFSKNSYPQFLVEIAGGNYLAKDTLKEMNDTVTIEKIISWNPDVIFTGRLKSTKIIKDNPSWSGLKAVQNNRVYLCPTGIKDWDYSSENILLLQYIAKMLHPELFKDIDMKKEIKYYYNTFYGYDISDENIENIIRAGLLLIFLRWRINILSLGEKEAKSLGINVEQLRGVAIICSTILTASSICLAGTIGWIGLVIPHLGRLLVGSDNRYLIPISTFLGASFLIVVDTLARNINGSEIPISLLTGFIGTPLYTWLLIKQHTKI